MTVSACAECVFSVTQLRMLGSENPASKLGFSLRVCRCDRAKASVYCTPVVALRYTGLP